MRALRWELLPYIGVRMEVIGSTDERLTDRHTVTVMYFIGYS